MIKINFNINSNIEDLGVNNLSDIVRETMNMICLDLQKDYEGTIAQGKLKVGDNQTSYAVVRIDKITEDEFQRVANFISVDIKIDEPDCFDMQEVCRMIAKRDDIKLNIGRTTMFEYLRNWEVLKRDNLPFQWGIRDGYFIVKAVKSGTMIHMTTFTTKKGIDYIVSEFKEHNITAEGRKRNKEVDNREGQ